ncbi:hypothetical protein CK203_078080 [Vitis vinifera]|uniref:Uncharacterized protein n=1 Tax=Vitis vinifera TaxID=29760 RepID=A0A438EU58_VITVI|nr:hypothetical protein CK203_078080 [Vitis vinifera]
MATPSRSRSSGRGEEDNFEWRQAIEKRQLANERQLQALLQETEMLREENAVANSRPEPESIYPGTAGAIPEAYNVRPHEPPIPMNQAPHEESSDSTHFSAKRQRDKRPQLSNSMHARLGPQEPRRPRPPAATTWEAHPDPIVTPMVQNVLPHHDPMVISMVQNVQPHLTIRQSGRNLPNEPPIGSISKRLDDMISTPFCSHIIHYEPQGDSSCPNSPHMMGPTTPSIISYIIDSS